MNYDSAGDYNASMSTTNQALASLNQQAMAGSSSGAYWSALQGGSGGGGAYHPIDQKMREHYEETIARQKQQLQDAALFNQALRVQIPAPPPKPATPLDWLDEAVGAVVARAFV